MVPFTLHKRLARLHCIMGLEVEPALYEGKISKVLQTHCIHCYMFCVVWTAGESPVLGLFDASDVKSRGSVRLVSSMLSRIEGTILQSRLDVAVVLSPSVLASCSGDVIVWGGVW